MLTRANIAESLTTPITHILAALALSVIVYWTTFGYLERQNNAVIEAEINGLSEQYERSGLAGLAEIINERVERDTERRSVYLLADAIERAK